MVQHGHAACANGALVNASAMRSTGPPSAAPAGRAAPMWGVALGITGIYLLSTLPSPLYVLYQRAFGFSVITLTVVYAFYVIGTIASMFLFGRLSDQIGRRPVVLVAFGIAVASAVVFLFVSSTVWLFPARILSGLAIALSAGASTAWVTELEPHHDTAKASKIVIGANTLGLGLGPVLSGVLAQFAPAPLVLPYIVFAIIIVIVGALVWRIPSATLRTKQSGAQLFRPHLEVPREIRARFVSPAIGTFAVFSVLGYYTALIPTLLSQALHNRNHAVAGAIVGGLFLAGAVAVAVTPLIDARKELIVSLLALIPGVALMVVAEAAHSMPLLIAATAIGGAASGIGYRCTLQLVNEMAPADRRSQVVSAYMIACYCGVSLPVVGVGVLSTFTAPVAADAIFAGVVVLFAIGALVTAVTLSASRRSHRAQA
jgi:MFS family permease